MEAMLPELKSFSMRKHVAEALRAALLEGHFRPGEPLSELELASQLKVSRGPVREAMLILTEEGLVNHSHNHGFAVIEISDQDAGMIDKVRVPLEAMVLNEARARVGEAELGELQRLLEELLKPFRYLDFPPTVRRDQAFHTRLWELSGNPWLSCALKRIMAPYFAFTMLYKMKDPELTYELMEKRHNMYLDYLRGAIVESAEDCVRFHLGLIRVTGGAAGAA